MRFKEYYLTEKSGLFFHGSPYEFDTFSLDKVGTGDGLNKFGFGLYFTDSEKLAEYYAGTYVSSKKSTGFNIYQVRIYDLENFYNWDYDTPDHIYNEVIRNLNKNGYESDAEQIIQDREDYGDNWSVENLYGFLNAVFDSEKEATEFLYECGLSGVITKDIHGRGNIYVAYSDDIVKIVDKWKVGKRNYEEDEL